MKQNLILACLTLSLVSCASVSFSSSSSQTMSSSSSSSSSSAYTIPTLDEKTPIDEDYDLYHIDKACGVRVLPSKGDVHLLVIPVEFSDYPFSSSDINDIDRALSGDGEADTGYWESLSSFYYKSSFGQVNLTFEIAPKLQTGMTAQTAYETRRGQGGADFIQEGISEYKRVHGSSSLQDFDSDDDGFIDGVIAIYSAPDYASGYLSYDQTGYFWAYTSWANRRTGARGNVSSPVLDLYFWASIDFLYEATWYSGAVDAHTLIHETGHMFGLDDYYPYSSSFAPMGYGCMMDANILDHDAYSKLSLGWIDPYVAEEESEIFLRPSYSSGDCLILPRESHNGTSFDEYLLIEYYVPGGLNAQDSAVQYPGRSRGISASGIKVYHVDARIMSVAKNGTAQYIDDIDEVYDQEYGMTYMIGATNAQKASHPANSNFSLVHMIERGGTNTFARGNSASSSSLFKTNDDFDPNDYAEAFFPNQKNYNCGSRFDYMISVDSMTAEGAHLSIIEI